MTTADQHQQCYATLDFGTMVPVPPRRAQQMTSMKKSPPTPTLSPPPAYHNATPQVSDEPDPRQFATTLCIFASVLTTVLVLMFYLVGEPAFRLVLLIITFVFVLTLCLACCLRRPTLVILGQTSSSNSNDLNSDSPQPFLLIFPTLFNSDNPTSLQGPSFPAQRY